MGSATRFASLCALGACYSGVPATQDVDRAWVGRTRGEIEARWGAPHDATAEVLHWSHEKLHVELPTGNATVVVEPGHIAAAADFHPGSIGHTTTDAEAFVDPAGVIGRVEGASLRWGPPNDVNMHWGLILGAHAGMGRLDSTATPLPSGEAYVGGMLSPTFALVGTTTMVAGTDTQGSAIGFAWGVAAQWWPVNRLWLRAGPALLLAFDPGFDNAALHPGLTAAASYAVVKVGTLAVDLCVDLALGPSQAFGTVGLGVNLN